MSDRRKKRANHTDTAPAEKSALYRVANGLDRTVNVLALLLFVIMLLYAGHSLWYSHSVKNDSFLSDELAKYRPDGQSPSLKALEEINPDVKAWLTIDDTNIDYPVVQGKDDSEYLNKSVLGEFSLAGSLFLSVFNKKDFSDPYNIVYGHHVEGGAMLADVLEFRNASFFKKHKTGILWYPDNDGKTRADRMEIFACLETETKDTVVYASPDTVTADKLIATADHIRENAVQKRKVQIDTDSRILGLSTCEDAQSFERVLLFGKLVPMTDKEIDAALAQIRDSEHKAGKGIWGLLRKLPPWLLPFCGILLLILLIYILWRARSRRKNDLR